MSYFCSLGGKTGRRTNPVRFGFYRKTTVDAKPKRMNFFSTYFLPFVLILITFSIGLTLTFKDFKNIVLHPKAMLVGLFGQLIGLPVLAFGLASFMGFSPVLQAGLMLIAACPGGATSNYVSYLSRGNVALSISMTAINSFAAILTLPGILYLTFDYFMGDGVQPVSVPLGQTVMGIVFYTILPSIGGMLLRRYRRATALWLNKRLEWLMLSMLAVAFTGVMLEKDEAAAPVLLSFPLGWVFVAALLLNVSAMFLGYGMARLLRLSNADQVTIGIEIGLQNSMLAITVAGSILQNVEMAQVGVIYGSFTFFSAAAFGLLMSQKVSLRQFFKTGKLYKEEAQATETED